MPKSKIIAIVGPTASGKTSLSIALAQKYRGEIISADSRQIYRGMDIGTAKVPILHASTSSGNTRELHLIYSENIAHYLIDIKDPNENYTVSDYKRDAELAISKIIDRGHLPFLVGGTGLYVQAVLENLNIPEIKTDLALRGKIEKDIADKGLEIVFEELVKLDPEAAYIVDPKNPRRVVRALEVALITGKPFTAQRKKSESPYDALKIGINPPPEVLRERINLRIDIMIQDGFVNEVQKLVERYGYDCIAFDAIGYREIIDYLKDKTSLQKAVEDMKMNTWHYAKRQITWFKRDKEIHWVQNEKEAEKLVGDFLSSGTISPAASLTRGA